MAFLVRVSCIAFMLAHALLLAYVQHSQAQFLNGANVGSCVSLTEPGVIPVTNSPSPFSLMLSQNFYRPGVDTIQVTLQSTGQGFTGFICQARLADGGQTFPVGTFQILPSQNEYRLLNCDFNPANPQSSASGTITNVDSSVKSLPFTVSYIPPLNLGGQDIVFITTVVGQDGSVFESIQSRRLYASVTELCPVDFNIGNIFPGATFAFATWTLPESTTTLIMIDGPFMTSGFFEVGTSTPTQYTFQDPLTGEMLVCGFVVSAIVEGDNTPPTISGCPSDITVNVPSGQTFFSVTWVEPTAVDNNGVATLVSRSNAPNSVFTAEKTIVTYIYADQVGNSAECTFCVNLIFDNELPVATCPDNIQVNSFPGDVGGVVQFIPPANCIDAEDGPITTTCSANSGTFFPGIGSNEVTCTCTDSSGGSGSCVFNITVLSVTTDNTPPTISGCPSDITVNVPSGQTFSFVTWAEPTAVDNSGVATLVSRSNAPNSVFTAEKTIVTYIYADEAGNTAECTFCVNLIFAVNLPPRITCLADLTVKADTGTPGASVNFNLPVCIDPDEGAASLSVSCSTAPGNFVSIGTIPVTCTCTDSVGASDTCVFSITVFENNPPAITCPDNISAVSFQGGVGAVVEYPTPTCFDAEDAPTALSISCSRPSGTFFQNIGPNVVTCTCTDTCDASVSCSFMVVIIVPNTPPVIQCIDDFSFKVTTNIPGASVPFNPPTCSDPDQSSGTLQLSCNPMSNSFFTIGTNTVTCTCTDNAGESDICTFTVDVFVNTLPSIPNCPVRLSVNSLTGNVGNVVSYDAPPCFDAEDGPLPTVCSPISGSFFQIGQTTVTCTCTDSCDEEDVCSFSVNVIELNEPPTITCFGDVSVKVNAGLNGSLVDFTFPICLDQDQSVESLGVSCSRTQNDFFTVGESAIDCTCIDNAGATDTCRFSVFITVNNLPTIINCPVTAVTADSISGTVGNSVSYANLQCSDAEDGPLPTVCSPISGSFFQVGETTVTCTCTDSCDEEDECLFSVIVSALDVTPPVVTCPGDTTVEVLTGNEGSIVTFENPSAVDDFGNAFLVSEAAWYSGFYFPLGETVDVFTYSDDAGNRATCSFTVTVIARSPCDSDPCLNGGECFAESLTDFTCVCSGCFQGNLCQIPIPSPCTVNTCLNGGECELYSGSCQQTFCDCPPCTRGNRCEIVIDPCADSPCANGAQCIPDPNDCSAYSCSCVSCFTGLLCENFFDPCSLNLCQNGAICQATGSSCLSYSCTCQGCFEGFNCDRPIPNPCNNSPCQNGGFCQRQDGSCSAYSCNCLPGFSGPLCQTRTLIVSNPCYLFPCRNNGWCVSLPNGEYKCLCRDGYSGIACEDLAEPPNSACDSNPCANGATCFNSYSTQSPAQFYIPQYTCVCPPDLSGVDCMSATSQNTVLDQCSQSGILCRNLGTCQNTYCSFTQEIGTYCNCPEGFYGEDCEFTATNPCLSSPCRNGGQCSSFTKYFVCLCVSGFSGPTCEVGVVDINPPNIVNCPGDIQVTANPGQSYAEVDWPDIVVFDDSGVVELLRSTALPGIYSVGTLSVIYQYQDPSENVATCSFLLTVLPAQVAPCDSSPCLNGGTCVDLPNAFRCLCDDGFSGDQCQFGDNALPVATCPGNIQVNSFPGDVGGVVQFIPPANCIDAEDGPITTTCSATSGTFFPGIGSNEVTCMCTDSSGGSGSCVFNITVLSVTTDNTLPTISGCPSDITVNVPSGQTFSLVTWAEPTAVDDSGVATLVSRSNAPNSVFTAEKTIVTYIYADEAGNTAECTFCVNLVFVVDVCNPSPCQNGGICFIAGTVVGYFCLCNGPFQGTNCENPTEDNEPPEVIQCPSDIEVTTTSGPVEVTWTEPFATDNSGITTLRSRSHFPGQTFELGKTTVQYIFSDTAENTASCAFCVTVTPVGGVCTPSTCQNGGICTTDALNGPVCNCPPEFAGVFCAEALSLVSSLPNGVLLPPGFGSNYADNVNLGFIVRGVAVLRVEVLLLDISPGDVLQIGSGEIVGQNVIRTFNGVSFSTEDGIVIDILDTSCWIVFMPNNDGNTGRGFVFRFMLLL